MMPGIIFAKTRSLLTVPCSCWGTQNSKYSVHFTPSYSNNIVIRAFKLHPKAELLLIMYHRICDMCFMIRANLPADHRRVCWGLLSLLGLEGGLFPWICWRLRPTSSTPTSFHRIPPFSSYRSRRPSLLRRVCLHTDSVSIHTVWQTSSSYPSTMSANCAGPYATIETLSRMRS